jgi:hypothetical protein
MIGGTDLDISCSSRSRRDDISRDAQSSIIESMAADIDLTVLCSDAIPPAGETVQYATTMLAHPKGRRTAPKAVDL